MTMTDTYERRSYGLWQKPRSAGLFGLRWGETVVGFAVVITALLTALVAGPQPAAVVAGVGLVVMVPLVWRTGAAPATRTD